MSDLVKLKVIVEGLKESSKASYINADNPVNSQFWCGSFNAYDMVLWNINELFKNQVSDSPKCSNKEQDVQECDARKDAI